MRQGAMMAQKDMPTDATKGKDKGPIVEWADQSGPSSTEQTLQNFKRMARKKRKTSRADPAGPSGQAGLRGANAADYHPPENRATINLNSAGYYEMQLQSEHISNLAIGCGFNISDVQGVIEMDNMQRQVSQQNDSEHTDNEEDDMEYDLSRFDLDPNDDLTSEEE